MHSLRKNNFCSLSGISGYSFLLSFGLATVCFAGCECLVSDSFVPRNPVSTSVMSIPTITDDALKEKIDTASAWCAAHGVLMGSRRRSEQDSSSTLYYNLYEPAPFALEPSPFPKAAFDKCYELGRPWNSIVHAVAESYETWLRPTLLATASSDEEFTGKLLSLADEVQNHNQRAQRVTLGILRSDYLLQSESSTTDSSAYPLQVELNTIASSFGCLSTKVTKLHQFLCHDLTQQQQQQLIENPAAVNIVDGLAAAFHEYTRQRSSATTSSTEVEYQPVVIMVVQPNEANACDQRDLEFLLFQRHGIKLLRRSLLDIANHAKHSSAFQNKELIVPSSDNGTWAAAAVVYFRAGYTPTDYPSDKEWNGRSKIEHSAAIKCPDVFYHLVGTKKVQQALAANNALRKFCRSDQEYHLVTSSFANLHSLGDDDDGDIVATAIANPHSFVLKPQREGGGNNLYDDAMAKALQEMTRKQRSAYILMQRIQPPTFMATLIKGGRPTFIESVCELGVFGVTLREYNEKGTSDGRVLLDNVGGHILRSKGATTDEGGVAAGYAFLSSPKLI